MLLLVIGSRILSATLSFASPLVTKSEKFPMHLIVIGSRILVKLFHLPVTKKSGVSSILALLLVFGLEISGTHFCALVGSLRWPFLCSGRRLWYSFMCSGQVFYVGHFCALVRDCYESIRKLVLLSWSFVFLLAQSFAGGGLRGVGFLLHRGVGVYQW